MTVEKLRWTRISTSEQPTVGHPHSFFRDGEDKRVTSVQVNRYLAAGFCLFKRRL